MLPAVNAGLNSLCTILLIAGYVSIRKKKVTLHKICMLSALVASAVFLSSYLFFHFAVLNGQPTRFLGEGWVRVMYFTLLISHTILAVLVAPLAIAVSYLGLRNRLASMCGSLAGRCRFGSMCRSRAWSCTLCCIGCIRRIRAVQVECYEPRP